MSIDMNNVVMRLSVVAAAGDTTASTPAASLGDQVSTSVVTSAAMNNLFPDAGSAEATAGSVTYRCVFLVNTDAETLISASVSMTAQTSGGGTYAIGLDPVGVVAVDSASAQAATIASATDAPAGVSFSTGPLSVGDLDTDEAIGVWVRRTISAGASSVADSGSITLSGDTVP